MVAVHLELENLNVRFGDRTAVAELSLRAEGGEILGLLGPNGSGKSSTLNAVAGIYEPAAGSIRINGISRRDRPAEYAALVGLVPQEPCLYEELSAIDNLHFFGRLYGLSQPHLKRRMAQVLAQVGMMERANCRLESLSGGMRRRINLACALLHEPAVLLLDEPTTALDPPSRETLFQTLEQLREDGRAIVLTTHSLEDAEQLCDRVAVLRQGRLIANGRLSEFQVGEWAMLTGQLRESLDEEMERAVRRRLGADVEFRVIGRRIRLRAPNGEELGLALSALYAEGVLLDSFRTPSARLEEFFLDDTETPIVEGSTCAVN